MGDWADEKASAMFPCNCNPFKDGSHWHDCQSQYVDYVADAFRQVAAEARQVENEKCRELIGARVGATQ